MILKQERKIKKLQKEINTLFARFQRDLDIEKDEKNEQVLQTSQRMSRLEQNEQSADQEPKKGTAIAHPPSDHLKKIRGL